MYGNQSSGVGMEAKRAAMSTDKACGEIRGGLAPANLATGDVTRSTATADAEQMLQRLVHQAMNISDRIEQMRIRTLGHFPESPSKDAPRPIQDGSVGRIFALMDMLDNVFQAQRDHLEALERVL